MSKRIVSFLLALIMFVGLVPAAAIGASAASLTASENVIKLIKEFEGFKSKAEWDSTQYSYGYGTKAPDKDAVITEQNADKALREELRVIDTKVNNFAVSNGLVLSQAKHDALVSFTFNVGWGWMSQSSYRITKAVASGASGNDFLQAMTLWSNVDSIPSVGLINRRMAEANLYLNGAYNKTAPSNYTYVKFDANGGVLGEDKVQAYNMNAPVTITSVPVREGYTFLGWYESTNENAVWVGVLNADTAKKTLYARWQNNDEAVDNGKVVGTPADYIISGMNFASDKVFAVPNSNNASVETIDKNGTFRVSAEYIDNNGDKWLKINSGWVKLGQIKVTTTTGTGTPTVTVTHKDGVNVRQEPSASATKVSALAKGTQVVITATREVNKELWGKFEQGWICLKYTNYGTITNLGGTTTDGSSSGSTVVIANGTVITNAINLNVRNGAGVNNGIVGTLARGTKVSIYEIKSVNGHNWGRIGESKWVCLDYVTYTMVATNNNNESSSAPAVMGEPFKFKATVNRDGLNIYADPTVSLANPIGSLNQNANVSIFEIVANDNEAFGKVISNNIIGWIQLKHTSYTATGTVSTANGKDIDLLDDAFAATGKKLKNGTAATILQIGAKGSDLYGRVKEGWIDLSCVKLDTTKAPIITGTQANASQSATTGQVVYTGIVNSGINLNVRLGAGVNFDVVNSLANGTAVKVYEKTVVNGHYWGKLGENAWICLSYVTDTTGTTQDTATNNNSNVTAMNEMATVVNCSTGVNIRSTPSVTGALMGSAALNSRVKVLETTIYNGTKWARTEQGWISMLYLKLDSDASYSSNSTVSVNGLFSATVLVNKVDVYDSISASGTSIATLKKGESVYIQDLQSSDYQTVCGKVTVNGKTGWLDLSNTTFVAKGQVDNATDKYINVRKSYSTSAEKVDTMDNGTFVTVLEIRAENVGAGQTRLWGKIASDKWVALENINLVATSASTPSNSTVVTTGLGKIAYTDTVNVRKAAGTTNDIITKLNRGTEVVLYEETVVDGAIWCRISTSSVNGWVAKDYIDVVFKPTTNTNNTTNNNTTGTGSNTTTTTQVSNYATGIVNSNIPLKVRQQPDINAGIVGELPKGMTITIYEQRKGGSMDWGRVDNGWVSLSYVTMTSTGSTGAGNMGTIIKAFSVVNVRAEATTESAKVGEVMVGSRVEVLDQKYVNGYNWYRINNGWVHGDYIELDAPFVSNAGSTNANNNTSAPTTGPQDEVGGMSTTAILKHRINEVVAFYNADCTTANGTKLVNGETVIITELKGYGTDVWANTKYGWFNLTDESINFTAIGLVNTTDNNYLNVYSEAGKNSTAPVDKIRDGASITLTGVAVSNGNLWGKTASGWVDLVHVELTCVKQGGNHPAVSTQPTDFTALDKKTGELFKAKSKSQHLSIAAYNQIGGNIIGAFQPNTDIYVVEVKAGVNDVWGRVAVTGDAGNVWIKLSDVTYTISTFIAVDCTATTSAAGSVAHGTGFKATNAVDVSNLTAAGGEIYAQIVSGSSKDGWLSISKLTKWTAIPEAETPLNFSAKIHGNPKAITYTYDDANGAIKGTLRDTAALVCISEIKADGSNVIWGKTVTDKGNRWVKLGDLNLAITGTVTVAGKGYTTAGGTTEAKSFKLGDAVSAKEIAANGGKFYIKDTASGAWIDMNLLDKFNGIALPAIGASLATSGTSAFTATTKYEAPIKNADFTGNAGTAAGGKTALVTKIVKNGETLWAEVLVNITAADYTQTADKRYIQLDHLNFTLNGTTSAQANVRSTMSTADSTNIYELLDANVALKIKGLTCGAGYIWATVEYAAGAGGIGYVATENVTMNVTIN